jgi:hypothetical protein
MFTCVNRSRKITPAATAISASGSAYAINAMIIPEITIAIWGVLFTG